MKLLSLFLQFLKIGAFAFGGGYGAISLIRETVLAQGWMDETQLMNLLGISESTPGPIMVNVATMTGFDQAGVMGSALATLGVILPCFLIMLWVPRLEKKWQGNRVLRLAMRGIRACMAGVICATGIHMAIQLFLSDSGEVRFDALALVLLGVLSAISLLWKKTRKKPMPPVLLILIAAGFGMAFFESF